MIEYLALLTKGENLLARERIVKFYAIDLFLHTVISILKIRRIGDVLIIIQIY